MPLLLKRDNPFSGSHTHSHLPFSILCTSIHPSQHNPTKPGTDPNEGQKGGSTLWTCVRVKLCPCPLLSLSLFYFNFFILFLFLFFFFFFFFLHKQPRGLKYKIKKVICRNDALTSSFATIPFFFFISL